MSAVTKRPADLSPDHKRALLAQLLQERAHKPSVFPASFSQEQLWFLDQMMPGLTAYNVYLAVRLTGQFDQKALERSLDEIARRHETLRTTFKILDGRPMQVIAPVCPEKTCLPLWVSDLQNIPQAEQTAEIQQLANREVQRPFDLAHGPLVRATLLKLAAEEHVLLLTTHHIISDGWSTSIIIRELGCLYQAFASGQPSPLPKLPIQYADYAVWQREWLQGETKEKLLRYWKERLVGESMTLDLPFDYVRPAVQSFRGSHHFVRFPASLYQGLQKLTEQEGVTLFITLLAAFKALLYRYTGQHDIVVGSPIANRDRAEIEGLIGFFINMLVLRTDLTGNPTFLELLKRVRETAFSAYAHSALPFAKLVEELQPQRDVSRSPLFQVMLVLQNVPGKVTELPDLKLSLLSTAKRGTTHYDLSAHLFENEQGLEGMFEYNTDLFKKETIERLVAHYQVLLEAIVAGPERRLTDLELLTEDERQQMLVEWNAPSVARSPCQCMHHLFESQVGQMSDAVAVIFKDQQLTFSALDRRANQLAHYLQKQDVGPDCLVGIYMERCLESMVGILGVLKAGGAYVPLDPTYPAERLAFMQADTQPLVLLTRAELANNFCSLDTKVVCLDTHWKIISQENDKNPISDVAADNLAYVIYTSGSTGKPKGVLVPHRGLPNVAQVMLQTFKLKPDDRVLQFSSLSFDASVYDILLALGSGATLCLAQEGLLPDLSLGQWLQDVGVTIVPLTASALAALQPEGLSLRIAISGAEACSTDLVARWSTNVRFFNVYGPTEATIWTTVAECTNNDQKPAIGRPISNAQVYILDRHLRPVPIGVAGEMCIGGVGLTRGYLNSPKLTAEKFIPNPFGAQVGTRLYRTGDLVRYLSNGNVDFLGRIDHQVKVRGFRIELGEIEAALGKHQLVQESVVLAREDKPGNKQLVAYVVAQEDQTPVPSDLRRFLKHSLPEYMVPSAFVILEALPLTPNGKIDRRALPAAGAARPDLGISFVKPRSPDEEKLAHIWAETLGLEQVGVHDNFFELGGDSILSIQVVTKANQLGFEITPQHIFQHQTIAELVAVGNHRLLPQAEQSMVIGSVPLVPIQHWFFEQNFVDPHHWNQAVLLQVQQTLDPDLLRRVLRQLLVHHDALRLRFVKGEMGWQQINAELGQDVPFECVDLTEVPSRECNRTINDVAAELHASLNLSDGPIVRAVLFDFGVNHTARLLIIIHHLAIDGVSWRVLLQDINSLYQHLKRGEGIRLLPKTTSFKEWATRLVTCVQSGALQSELDYWLTQLQKERYDLPLDKPGGINVVGSIQNVLVSLDERETRLLLQEVPQVYHTHINDVLLTALVQAFARWTGKPFLFLDLEGHGREMLFESVDLSRTVGWFTSMFPVRLDLGEDSFDPGEALKSVKEQLRRVPRQGISYGLLRYLSQDEKVVERLRALPRAQVSFNYLGQFDQLFEETALFKPAQEESSGPARSLRGKCSHLIEINSLVSDSQLQVVFNFSENLYGRNTIECLAQDFIAALRLLTTHCLSPEAGGYTLSDFPEADLNQAALERIMAQLDD